MKELKKSDYVKLSKFQKEIINKLDDEYWYEIITPYNEYYEYISKIDKIDDNDYRKTIINIFNKEMKLLYRIDDHEDKSSIKKDIKDYEENIEKTLYRNNDIVKSSKEKIKFLKILLKGNK